MTQGRQSQDANFGDWDSKKSKYLVYDVIYETEYQYSFLSTTKKLTTLKNYIF